MSVQEVPSAQSVAQVEQNVLSLINNGQSTGAAGDSFQIEELLQNLDRLHNWNATDSRDQCFLMSQQFLMDSKDLKSLVRLLKQRAQWLGNSPAYGEECRDVLTTGAVSRLEEAIVASVPFSVEKPFECLKRVENLLRLTPGTAVADRAWGYGVVVGADEFYKRVTIDFDSKAGHSMSFAFAATALKPVSPEHILAIRHKDIAAFNELCAKDPARVVELAITSYGPMSVPQMEQELSGKILPAGMEFKDFWTRARNKLRKDPRWTIPPVNRKGEAVSFAESASSIGDARWFSDLSKSKRIHLKIKANPKDESTLPILDEMEKLAERGAAPADAERRAVLVDRLSFVLKAAAATRDNDVKVRAILVALSLGFSEIEVALKARQNEEFAMVEGKENAVDLRATLAKPSVALNAARRNPRHLKEMVALIPIKENNEIAEAFISAIPQMPYSLLEIVAPQLLESSSSASFTEFVRNAFTVADIPLQLVHWICALQGDDRVAAILPASVVATQAVLALEPEVAGEELTQQHAIANFFKTPKGAADAKNKKWWLGEISSRMPAEERAALFVRIRAVDEGAWGPLEKRMIEKALVEAHPELARITAADSAAQEAVLQRITSVRSYGERQAQFRELVDVRIPKNAQDIDTARSFGDLRENFEYQVARDEQRMLLQQQIDMQQELRAVKPVTFEEVAFDGGVVSGTEALLTYPDGSVKIYRILGEWDSDLAQGIISSRSRIAELLSGRRAGDKVELPTEDESTVEVVLTAVNPLPGEIVDWANNRG